MPHGVSRGTSRMCSGVAISGVRFWNFTACAPHSTATSMSRFAISTSPLWFRPISPIT